MKKFSIHALRVVWASILLISALSLISGTAVQPLHPFNLILSSLILLGAVTIWFPSTHQMVISASCAILAALMMGFQVWAITSMFPDTPELQFRIRIGSFELHGLTALLSIMLPPILLIWLSATLLIEVLLRTSASTKTA